MWDQYGDKYKGLCILFSKKKLIDRDDKNSYQIKEVEYKTFNELTETSFQSYNTDIYNKIGEEEFIKIKKEQILLSAFYKHKEYGDEKEFRICYFGDEGYELIDVSDSIVGLVISDIENQSEFYKQQVAICAENLNIPAFCIYWRNRGIDSINTIKPNSF